jgi:hypothetical protein
MEEWLTDYRAKLMKRCKALVKVMPSCASLLYIVHRKDN